MLQQHVATQNWNNRIKRVELWVSLKKKVTVYGSKGKNEFSVFDEVPIILSNEKRNNETFIAHTKNIQFNHVQEIKKQLLGNTPSDGKTATHTWL
jgi:hypothetical protein